MVHRNKDINNPPQALADAKWNSLKSSVLTELHAHDPRSACYRDCTLDALKTLYKEKCAICERERGDELEVDHYRPTKPRTKESLPPRNHNGYYWLSYEWFNLMPLCSKCNNKKSNKFPLRGNPNVNRIDSHVSVNGSHPYNRDWLQQYELPLIINPEYDQAPERHFIYDRNGRIRHVTDEGEGTIEACELNRRELIRTRKKVINGYVKAIKEAFDDFERTRNEAELRGELKGVFKDIHRNRHIDKEYSLMHIYTFKYFGFFIDNRLPVNLRGKALKYFTDYKQRYGIQ